MSKDTSGPAFPTATLAQKTEGGMSLRDYFAAKALQAATFGHIAHYGHDSGYWPESGIASYAYALADAMLEARKS